MSLIPAFKIGVWNAWIFAVWLVLQNLGFMLLNKEAYKKAGNPPDMKLSKTYKIVSFLSMPLWLLAVAYSIFLPLKLGTIWFAIGLVIYLLGLSMSITATINFAAAPVNEPVTGGVYRFSRHPLYISLVLIYLGIGVAAASWVFILYAIIWAFLLNISVKDEEFFCSEKYGEAYRGYMNSTPRWLGIPRVESPK
jgi:protein-S-isoprenylcysteine O-methyltransferase Ste14